MSIRQVILDTETTGLSPDTGHRIIEIGCIELIDRHITDRHYHVYLNPERDVDEGAFRVHGISRDFLKDKPRFSDIVDDFLNFITGSELIIHNAPFDVGFIEAELKRTAKPANLQHYATVFDTLVYARNKHPGARNNLDALCKRYQVDNSHRAFHGALLDADILARLYLAMTGGQIDLFGESVQPQSEQMTPIFHQPEKLSSSSPVIWASESEIQAHEAFMALLNHKKP